MKKNYRPLAYLLTFAATTCLACPAGVWSQSPPAVAPAGGAVATPPATSQPALPAPPADVQAALAMPAGDARNKAVSAAAKAWAASDSKGELAWILAQPPAVSGPMGMTVGANGDLPTAKESADFLVAQDSLKAEKLLHGLVLNWTRKDYAAAQAWCEQLKTSRDMQFAAYFTVGDGLCRKDPKLAIAWVDKLTDPDQHAAAIDGTATIWCRFDLTAATVWVKQLNPVDMKRAAQSVAASWGLAKPKGDATLKTWLDGLTLDPADKQEILKGPQPDSFQISKYKAAPATKPSKP